MGVPALPKQLTHPAWLAKFLQVPLPDICKGKENIRRIQGGPKEDTRRARAGLHTQHRMERVQDLKTAF
eukprot:1139786-Pelagomonas_calceolata.AAC.2